MGERSLRTKLGKSEHTKGIGWGGEGVGVGRYANPLNGCSTSVSSLSSFSYCLMKVYIRMQLLYIPNVRFLNTCLKEHILLRRKCHWSYEKKTVSTKVPEVRGLPDKKQLCTCEAVLDQDADGSRGQNQRGEAETVSSRKILSGNWKIGPPHPDCLNNDAWKKVRAGKLLPKWLVELWVQNYKL